MRCASAILLPILAALAGCGGAPPAPEPPLRAQAYATEQDGARRHARGDLPGALGSFILAERQFVALDDGDGAARNRRHRARIALEQGKAEEAAGLTAAMQGDAEAQLIAAQGMLGSGRAGEAAKHLDAAAIACSPPCPHTVGISLMRARLALATAEPAAAERHAREGLALLARGDAANPLELANAHRLLAEALLGQKRAADAEGAALHALDLDRKSARPAKIARDWLLLGCIRRAIGPDASAISRAREAYRHALDIADAAALPEIVKAADAALAKE